MKSWFKHLASIILVTMAFTAQAETPVPPVGQRVTDLAQTLTPSEVATLAHELERIDTDTGARVLVLIVDSLQGESIEQYATRVFDSWKPGRKGVDDGVIILLAKKERKMRIEVGRGLEGAITDLTAKRITSEKMVPAFKQSHFAQGFTDAAHEIERLARSEKLQPHVAAQPSDSDLIVRGALILLTLCGLCGIIWVVVRNRRVKAEQAEQAENLRALKLAEYRASRMLNPVLEEHRVSRLPKPVTGPDIASQPARTIAPTKRSSLSSNAATKAAVVAASSSRSMSSSRLDDSSSRTSSSYDSDSSSSSNSYSSDSSSGSSAGGGASDSY